jgi:hypothetical protein
LQRIVKALKEIGPQQQGHLFYWLRGEKIVVNFNGYGEKIGAFILMA